MALSAIDIAEQYRTIMPTVKSREIDAEKATCMTINSRGTILAIGFRHGLLVCCDSLTFGNQYEYEGRSHSITSISFSSTSRSITSGDTSGTLLVHDTLTKATKFQYQFESGITDTRFVPNSEDRILVVLKNHDLLLLTISTTSTVKFCAPVTSIDWGPAPGTVYGLFKKRVSLFNVDDPSTCRDIEIEHAKSVSYSRIMSSPTGDPFVLFSNRGTVHVYTADGGYVVTYADKIGGIQYNCGCFWDSGRQLMLGSTGNADSAFVSYIVGGQEIIFFDMQSSKMPTVQMLPNPRKPWLYMLGRKSVQLWTPSRNRLVPSCPIGQQMITNSEFYEREDEWDASNTFPSDKYHEMYRHGIFKDEEEDQCDVSADELIELPCVW